MSPLFIDIFLFTLLAMTALAIARLRNLFAVTMLASIFSLLAAGLFVNLDAVDVAFTEAAVGGGISTVLMLGALTLTKRDEKRSGRTAWLALLLCAVTGAGLVYGTLDMPAFGSPDAPIHAHVAPEYIARAKPETGVPNIVTAVLASYRGYDTLGETTVIFAAAIAVLLLLGFKHSENREGSEE